VSPRRSRAAGLTVRVVDDDALGTARPTGDVEGFAEADLIVVSSSVVPSSVPAWLADLDTPILNNEVFAATRLRLGTLPKEVAGSTSLDIGDHPVGAPSRGRVVVSSATTLGSVVPAPGGHVVATIAGRPSGAALVLYEAGAAGSARRANTFLAYPAPLALSDAGWGLVDRTIEWLLWRGGSTPPTTTPPTTTPPTTTPPTTAPPTTAPPTTAPPTTAPPTTAPPTTAPPTTAPPTHDHLWVAAGATGNCRASTSPCGTIAAAVGLAVGGETILVAPGRYRGPNGTQNYRNAAIPRTREVVIKPSSPDGIVILSGHHEVYTTHLVFDGLRIERGALRFRAGGHDGGARNLRVTFGNVSFLGADRGFVRDSVFRDNEEWDFIMIGLGADDIEIAGNDMRNNPEIDFTDFDHADCIEVVGPDRGVRILDNLFTDCGHAAMQFVSSRGPIDDALVKGNYFQECRVRTAGCYADVSVKLNDGRTRLRGPGGHSMTNVRLVDNVFDGGLLLKVTTKVVVVDNEMSGGRKRIGLEVHDTCAVHDIRGNTIESYVGSGCGGLPALNTIGPADCSPSLACGVDPRLR
jgi:hypothetical protein